MKACQYCFNPTYKRLNCFPCLWRGWGSSLRGCQVVFHGDRDAARASLIAGRASMSVGEKILLSFVSHMR